MTSPRTKKMTDPLYFPTTPANESEVRTLHDDMYEEIFNNLNAGKAEQSDFNNHKTSSDHDGRYYTEAEVNALLSTITVAGLSPDSILDSYLKQTGSNILPNFNTHLADDVRHLTTTNQNKIDRAYSTSKLYAYKNIGGAL